DARFLRSRARAAPCAKTCRLVSRSSCRPHTGGQQDGGDDLARSRLRGRNSAAPHRAGGGRPAERGRMNGDSGRDRQSAVGGDLANSVLNAIQNAVILVDEEGYIAFANWEAESFFGASAAYLARHTIYAYIPFGSPMLTLIDQVRERR